ncbi:MAG: DmsC/YnfH family molybdoenzyme membrane anchor subunit [Campylobacterota bacterium]|nr:DmsC/YnfH family molybdoenzyme membrane anchor subunit [Campylobacterota bacterium]
MTTPLESFIDHKAQTGMQCGNYSIELPELKDGEQYRFHFDATACVGCRCCEVACNEQNNNPADIKWRRVGEMEGGEFPNTLQLFNSMSCNHCEDPACLIGCPTESYIKFDNGIVFHDDDICIGCSYCTWNCPYEVPVFHNERKIVTKCHMCHERLDANQSPACVQACPAGAIEIEAVKIDEWLKKDIDTQGNMPHLSDARVTNSTTRYTLPKDMPENISRSDEHILKPFHSEFPLVFMTLLTQMSLGAFFALFLGDVFSLLGFEKPNYIMAIAVFLPAAIGLPLSALHLGRPILATTAMKNIKNSWLSREALALGIFTALMTLNVALYFFDAPTILRIIFELITLMVGVIGIYSQAKIYTLPARPSWNRKTTILKFFSTGYIGLYLVAFVAIITSNYSAATPLITLGIMVAIAHGFFSYEDRRDLENPKKDREQIAKTLRLYRENFSLHVNIRVMSFVVGALMLPLLASVMVGASFYGASIVVMVLALIVMSFSEFIDRFLFYVTSTSLGMAGSFFVGTQR